MLQCVGRGARQEHACMRKHVCSYKLKRTPVCAGSVASHRQCCCNVALALPQALLTHSLACRVHRSGNEVNPSQLKALQTERVATLAINLTAILKRYTQGDQEGFRISQEEEAARLAAASYGPTMLGLIGKTYELQADIYLGGFVDGALAKFRWACLLPAACCLLPAACCLLPAACCLLPAACCLPPAACRLP